jgi:glycosyltransferase involved in cell wall biosynthesis
MRYRSPPQFAAVRFVGRISPEKGVHVLLEAFQKVILRHPQARLEIVGPEAMPPIEFIVALSENPKVSDLASFYHGSYLSRLQDKLSVEARRRVSFGGFVPHTQLVDRFQEAEVLIQPSVWDEPFGMPIVEAMACQVPVIATRSGGITEIVEAGRSGVLVEPDNAPALAEAIVRLLENGALRKAMGESGRERPLSFFLGNGLLKICCANTSISVKVSVELVLV